MSTRKRNNFSALGFAEATSTFSKKIAQLPDFVFYLIPLAVLSVWLIVLILTDKFYAPQTYYLLQFLYTYDHGYNPRGLFGEIIGWFVDVVTDEFVLNTYIFLDVFLVIAASLFIGKILSSAKKDAHTFSVIGFLCIFSCFLPLSYGDFFIDVKLDRLLWIITFFALYIIDSKYLVWLIPGLCVFATLINPIFLFISMLPISIILLYKYFDSSFSVKNLILCLSSYVPMLGIGLADPYLQKQLGFKDAEEMILFYFSRYENPLSQKVIDSLSSYCVIDYFGDYTDTFWTIQELYFPQIYGGPASISCFFFVAIPAFAFFTWLWVKAIKTEPDKFKKFIYFLCAVIPVLTIPLTLVTWEFAKYFAHTVLMEFCLIVYFFLQKDLEFKKVIDSCIGFLKNNPLIAILVGTYILAFI